MTKSTEETLLTEYAATHDGYLHYDNFSWQVGAVLIAGTFVFFGFLLDKVLDNITFFAASMLVTSLMSLWALYGSHNRQIMLCKLHRIHELEADLGMQQNIRWVKEYGTPPLKYRTFGPHGYELDAAIYFMVSLGMPIIWLVKLGYSWLMLIPVVVTILCLIILRYNEHRIKGLLRAITQNAQQSLPADARTSRG
jgi:hypothetical protein